jgi:hypothetical protein
VNATSYGVSPRCPTPNDLKKMVHREVKNVGLDNLNANLPAKRKMIQLNSKRKFTATKYRHLSVILFSLDQARHVTNFTAYEMG